LFSIVLCDAAGAEIRAAPALRARTHCFFIVVYNGGGLARCCFGRSGGAGSRSAAVRSFTDAKLGRDRR
jgi:hypothetical protein